jgi:hypothetical protein
MLSECTTIGSVGGRAVESISGGQLVGHVEEVGGHLVLVVLGESGAI